METFRSAPPILVIISSNLISLSLAGRVFILCNYRSHIIQDISLNFQLLHLDFYQSSST